MTWKIFDRIKRAFIGEPERERVPRQPRPVVRRSRALTKFENSATEKAILRILAVREPMTVAMVRDILRNTTTIAQAMPAMWKRGVLVRRREAGKNTYWYARTLDAFAISIEREPLRFTADEGRRLSAYERMLRDEGRSTLGDGAWPQQGLSDQDAKLQDAHEAPADDPSLRH